MMAGKTELSMDGRADGEAQRGDLGKRRTRKRKLPRKTHHQKNPREWRCSALIPSVGDGHRQYSTDSVVLCCESGVSC